MKMNGALVFETEGQRYPTRRSSTYQFDVELKNVPSDVIGAFTGVYTDEQEELVRFCQGLLSGFRYKPDWHFSIDRRPPQVMLTITFTAPDSRGCQMVAYGEEHLWDRDGAKRIVTTRYAPATVPVTGSFAISPGLMRATNRKKAFWDFLYAHILFVERHEMDEWFRVDGHLPFDPHR